MGSLARAAVLATLTALMGSYGLGWSGPSLSAPPGDGCSCDATDVLSSARAGDPADRPAAHEAADDGRDARGSEDGCPPDCDHCPCCSAPVMAGAAVGVGVAPVPRCTFAGIQPSRMPCPEGPVSGIFRPPRA